MRSYPGAELPKLTITRNDADAHRLSDRPPTNHCTEGIEIFPRVGQSFVIEGCYQGDAVSVQASGLKPRFLCAEKLKVYKTELDEL